jgi:hypothetical protein
MLALIAVLAIVPASAMAAKKSKTLTVCKHGCKYDSIQDAVDAVKKKNTTINVKPGTYKEGVTAQGHKYDGLTVQGTKKDASKVVLQGKNAKDADGQPANNGIETVKADDVTFKNMTAKNYLANGFHIVDCNGYLMDNLIASYNRAYGLFAFDCIGGKMQNSVGYGQGDSAYYVGETPPQDKPKKTVLTNLDGHENVLGFSGTNSKYVTIQNSAFYNNGVGVVPNTLDSEEFEPNSNNVIKNNAIFWNNFNYFLPNSKVHTVGNGGLGVVEGVGTIQYPTGVGVVLLGSDTVTVQDNEIFGNFKAGGWTVSDPTNDGDNAISLNNQWLNNQMGRGGTDTNQVDFFFDGSGSGNCWSGNQSSTFDPSSTTPNAILYPTCPALPGTGGNGSSLGDSEQFGELLNYVTTDPPEKQQCSWEVHDHPAYKKYKPFMLEPGPTC